ncbi:hypothetical protein JCM10450v2_006514 [Rhodotorula kratochvilovae]
MPRAQQESREGTAYSHWLIKAQPETRIEKGVDVKFSIDDLEEKRTTTWEGVRNHEAKKYLKSQMKVGHTCLFYASNCKIPGVTGLARVIKEGYPDFNAWDPKHPYYDPKSKQDSPTWFMVDVEFIAKFAHPVPLALLQHLASLAPSTTSLPPALAAYLSPAHLAAIAESALIKRGRLSVQPASEGFYEAVRAMGEKGGWEGWDAWGKKGKGAKGKGKAKKEGEGEEKEEVAPKPALKPKRGAASAKKRVPPPLPPASEDDDDAAGASSEEEDTTGGRGRAGGKRGAPAAAGATGGRRSSKRLRGGGDAKA